MNFDLTKNFKFKQFRVKPKLCILLILDESASVGKFKKNIIEGFNKFIEQQNELEDNSLFYFIKFNTKFEIVVDGSRFGDIDRLTGQSYKPRGATLLYDTIPIGIHKAGRKKCLEDKVIVVIFTDGVDSHSNIGGKTRLKELIRLHEETTDWTFLYIGARPNEWLSDSEFMRHTQIRNENIVSDFESIGSTVKSIRENLKFELESHEDVHYLDY